MKIHQSYALNEIIQRQDTKNRSENENFSATLDKTLSKSKKLDTKELSSVTNSDVEEFLHKLTSMGASAFWLNFNLEKIEDKVNKKRDELIEKLGLCDDKQINIEEERKEALEKLDEMLKEYIDSLLAQMEFKQELKNAQKSPLNQIFSQNLLDI